MGDVDRSALTPRLKRRQYLSMPASNACFVGLDLGGTLLKAGRTGETGTVDSRLSLPVVAGPARALFDQLEEAVRSLAEAPGGAAVQSIGIGVPGIVDPRGRVHGAPNLRVLEDKAPAEEIARRLGLPTFVENDANVAALAESWLGAGRGAQSLILLTLGTGVGGGLVLGGTLWSGANGYAGEIGHIQAERDGEPCGCGSRGCVETVAGAKGWIRKARALLATRPSSLRGRDLDPEIIVAAARDGDVVALEVVDAAAEALGVGIAAALDLLNVERVIFAGGVAKAGPFFLDRVVEATRRRTFSEVFASCSFRSAELGSDSGVIGAARLAMMRLAAEG